MTYEYLIKRLLPFSLGFLAAVFVTSLFQAFGYLGQTANVPEVSSTSYSRGYACKTKFRNHGTGYGYGTGSGVGSSSSDSSLRILHKPRPEYTDVARTNGTEGVVRLRVTFLANGEVGNITALNDLGDGLTEEAVIAARKLQFEPATLNGVPTSVTKTLEYTFSIY